MAKIRIYGGGMTRFSKEIIEAGFAPGTEAEILKNAFSFTVVKPGATLNQIEHSVMRRYSACGSRAASGAFLISASAPRQLGLS